MFRDPVLAARFEHDGFVVAPLLDAPALAEIATLFERVRPERVTGIYSNVHTASREDNLLIDATLRGLFERGAAELFADDCYLAGASFLVKAIGEGSESKLHQDWSIVDESRFTSLSMWVPLVDVDERNGALQVFRGSHRLFPTLRSLTIPSLYLEFDAELEPLLTPVTMRAGEVCVFAHSLFHGSKPNASGAVRIAAVCGVLPRAAQQVHYWRDPSGAGDEVEAFAVDQDFYYSDLKSLAAGQRPGHLPLVETVRHPRQPLDRAAVLTRMREQGPPALRPPAPPAPPTPPASRPAPASRESRPSRWRSAWRRLTGAAAS